MTQEAFLRELEEALEIGANSLDEAKALQDVESWDSMSALIFMGLADEKLQVAVTGRQMAECKTVGDLIALLGDAIKN